MGLSTAHEKGKALEVVYSSQARSRVLQLKTQLQTIRKGSLSMDEYLTKMKMVADKDLMLHVLAGLGPEYDSVVVNLTARLVPATWQEAQALLLNQESRIDQMNATMNWISQMPLLTMSLIKRLKVGIAKTLMEEAEAQDQTNSEEVGVDVDEVLEEIPSLHVKSVTKLDTPLFVAIIDLPMPFKLLRTIRFQPSLPHLNRSLISPGMLIVEPLTMSLLNLATSL